MWKNYGVFARHTLNGRFCIPDEAVDDILVFELELGNRQIALFSFVKKLIKTFDDCRIQFVSVLLLKVDQSGLCL